MKVDFPSGLSEVVGAGHTDGLEPSCRSPYEQDPYEQESVSMNVGLTQLSVICSSSWHECLEDNCNRSNQTVALAAVLLRRP